MIIFQVCSSWSYGQCYKVCIPASTDHGSVGAGLSGKIGVNVLSRSGLDIARAPLISGAACNTMVSVLVFRKSPREAVGG